MTTNSNATTYPLDEGRRVAMQDIKKLMKKREEDALESGDPESFWEGYFSYFKDFSEDI